MNNFFLQIRFVIYVQNIFKNKELDSNRTQSHLKNLTFIVCWLLWKMVGDNLNGIYLKSMGVFYAIITNKFLKASYILK